MNQISNETKRQGATIVKQLSDRPIMLLEKAADLMNCMYAGVNCTAITYCLLT